MKLLRYLPLMLLAACFQACGDGMIKNKQTDSVENTVQQVVQPVERKVNHVLQVEYTEDLIGDWVGMFEPDTAYMKADEEGGSLSHKITISIDQINGTEVKGHSVVAGNYRPFTGTVEDEEKKFVFTVAEPGDDQFDGKFDFTIPKGDSLLIGGWKSYKEIKIPARNYKLNKRFFKYDPQRRLEDFPYVNWKKSKQQEQDYDGEKSMEEAFYSTTEDVRKYNASTQELKREKVANMKKADIYILRNSIFARHGFSFKNKDLMTYFDMQEWYMPVSINIEKNLTALEKKNISLLMKYEKHAEEYYDVFGR
ncbi:YARHG domain-containing protein [Pedobacter duraquae]|uniref:YARHG domain-containing protein n=1 Tax=Pedobacter duraquae TaxID=425511 RepID=A0A4R6IKJ3_9SPHI|nr:YARHG domain-containing protein [Pedobacter duraquae]TDO22600.1 YARHG domain-containing protein [Pedobacter duraquae]